MSLARVLKWGCPKKALPFSPINIEICLLLILLEMTKIDEDVGELVDDVTLEDVVGLKNFLRPECVRVSLNKLEITERISFTRWFISSDK